MKTILLLLVSALAWAQSQPPAVSVFFTGAGTVLTDYSGSYSVTVPAGYTGSAVPSAAGFVFTPQALGFANVVLDLPGTNFVGTDIQPPSVSITYPNSGNLPRATVSLGCNASDNWYVKQVQWYVDGALIGIATAQPFSVAWNAAVIKGKGNHTLTATAVDGHGNTSSASVQFRVY